MFAITLHQPWAYAIAHLGKDIENRTWRPHLQSGALLAIHAGKKFDQEGADWITNELGLLLPEKASRETGIIAIARFKGCVEQSDSCWFVGPIGWQLELMTTVERVDIPGKQGLWRVPEEIESKFLPF